MKNAKLIVDGKEIEVQINEEDLKKITTTDKITGYERVNGGYYYYDNGYTVDTILDTGNPTSVDLYDNANYYSNINIANNNVRADNLMRQLRRFAAENRKEYIDWENKNQDKYYLRYDYLNKKIYVGLIQSFRDFGQIYFDTKDIAELAMEKFKNELLWYFTEYRDSL